MEIYDEDAIGVAAFEDSIEATRGGRGRNGTTDDTQSLDFVAGWSALRNNNNNRAHTIDVSTVAAAVSNDNRIRRQSRDEIFGTQFRHQAISIDFYDYDYDSNYDENGDEDDIIDDNDDDDDDLGSCRDSDHYAEDDRPQLRRRLYEYVQQSTKQEIDPSEYIFTSHCVMSRDLGNNRTRGTFLMTTGDDHKFIRLMTALLVHQKDLLPLRRLVKWSTILIAFFSVALYIMVEVSLYMTSEESSDDGVMCVLRIFSSVMVTIPNISFRKQLKNLMEREHSRMILLTVNPKKYIKICSCFLVFELTFAGFTSYYWGESYWPEIEAANISYSGRYALMVFHPMNIIVTNLWNFAIAIICMLMCSNLVDELGPEQEYSGKTLDRAGSEHAYSGTNLVRAGSEQAYSGTTLEEQAQSRPTLFYSVINSVKTDTRVDLLCDQLCQDRLQSRPTLRSTLSRQIPEQTYSVFYSVKTRPRVERCRTLGEPCFSSDSAPNAGRTLLRL
ncbi:uncharacterized protein LOC142340491 [Convolutriloba macropyga]|uniref:uncharacterized protein LOC142340491 n=1 Tax=Convolutriloba macropyga TaxID=536237 RepID=UPI003F5248B9